MPRTVPKVEGPKALSCWGQIGANLTLSSEQMERYRNLPILRTLFELQCVLFLVQNVLLIFFDSSKHGRWFRLAIQIIERDDFGLLGQFIKKNFAVRS
jgi:hypothetical protein